VNQRRPFFLICLISSTLLCARAVAQTKTAPSAQVTPQATPTADALGRTTPRGTVLGFLKAARQGRNEVAAEYLNTRLRGQAAASLAHELFVVLDRHLPARLNELSDRPEGSLSVPAKPDEEQVGTISSQGAAVDIFLERINRGKTGRLWLFSKATLEVIPELSAETNIESLKRVLPPFLVTTEIAGIALFEWVALFGGLPAFFLALVFLNRLLSRVFGRLRRLARKDLSQPDPNVLPAPIRILLLAATVRWALSKVALPLLARQFWSSTATILTIAALVWFACLLTGWIERRFRAHSIERDNAGVVSLLRLARWGVNLVIVIVGLLIGLRHFGINPNAGLAGLGVGGIAVALAAQKTLENVVGGVSIILDGTVHVGHLVKVGETLGFVEDIGLRSTCLRTFDRTMVSVPNGQLATATLENLSLRDRFWFHHILRLRHETTTSQMRSILESVTNLLTSHPSALREPIRVRFHCFGTSSFDVEIFSYLTAPNWDEFLRLQEELLLQIREVVQNAKAQLAIPAHATYLISSAADSSSGPRLRNFAPSLASGASGSPGCRS